MTDPFLILTAGVKTWLRAKWRLPQTFSKFKAKWQEFGKDKQHSAGQPQWYRPGTVIAFAALTLGCKCSKTLGSSSWPPRRDNSGNRNGPLAGETKRRRLIALPQRSWAEPYTDVIAFPSEGVISFSISTTLLCLPVKYISHKFC